MGKTLDQMGPEILAECQEVYGNHIPSYDDLVNKKDIVIPKPYFLLTEIKSLFGNKVFNYLRGRK